MIYNIRIREIMTHEFEMEADSYENALKLVGKCHEEEIREAPVTNIIYDLESILPARRLIK